MASKTMEEHQSYRDYIRNNEPKKFTTVNKSAKEFVSAVMDGSYDLEPEHQREVVHNDKWQSEVVKYLMEGKPLGCPEFDSVLDEDGVPKYRSLDGKQRCSAIVRFMTNQYAFKSNIPGIKGKKFMDWSKEWRTHLERSQFAICQSDSTFNDDEVSQFFMTKQNTKTTKTGEKLNSINSERIKLCRDIVTKVALKRTDRHAGLEMVSRMIYLIANIDSGRKLDPKPAVLINYMKRIGLNDENLFNQYESFINKTICLNNSITYENQHNKTSLLPLLTLILRRPYNFNDISNFVIEKLDNKKFYENVGGDHDATMDRSKRLIDAYDEWSTRVP
jgi:hypothetical protein